MQKRKHRRFHPSGRFIAEAHAAAPVASMAHLEIA